MAHLNNIEHWQTINKILGYNLDKFKHMRSKHIDDSIDDMQFERFMRNLSEAERKEIKKYELDIVYSRFLCALYGIDYVQPHSKKLKLASMRRYQKRFFG